ncbi:hypothetical protein MBM_09292 [Drepanopeziza brunnea f. sp. 'multigermtubi' MB_m1]|uniref:Uncharacterized protein n=1 Tax=Marssonina brunnea f. sp. multigermtubi (strain MB_m1) TaxID=1072389 RepID=K1WI66_MARBU|nr:uncharacterized protein MBM_09292 [Drepanopeziza brunnea f. sp. 'multigermtubi' MB_m1]EKD12536.1 hypothetical protein MBM_09292 [Drepanopeziza brunnea f. sp. 'multigermtubi' MB_m1]
MTTGQKLSRDDYLLLNSLLTAPPAVEYMSRHGGPEDYYRLHRQAILKSIGWLPLWTKEDPDGREAIDELIGAKLAAIWGARDLYDSGSTSESEPESQQQDQAQPQDHYQLSKSAIPLPERELLAAAVVPPPAPLPLEIEPRFVSQPAASPNPNRISKLLVASSTWIWLMPILCLIAPLLWYRESVVGFIHLCLQVGAALASTVWAVALAFFASKLTQAKNNGLTATNPVIQAPCHCPIATITQVVTSTETVLVPSSVPTSTVSIFITETLAAITSMETATVIVTIAGAVMTLDTPTLSLFSPVTVTETIMTHAGILSPPPPSPVSPKHTLDAGVFSLGNTLFQHILAIFPLHTLFSFSFSPFSPFLTHLGLTLIFAILALWTFLALFTIYSALKSIQARLFQTTTAARPGPPLGPAASEERSEENNDDALPLSDSDFHDNAESDGHDTTSELQSGGGGGGRIWRRRGSQQQQQQQQQDSERERERSAVEILADLRDVARLGYMELGDALSQDAPLERSRRT